MRKSIGTSTHDTTAAPREAHHAITRATATLITLLAVLLISCQDGTTDVRTLKLAHNMPKTHSVHQGLEYMRHYLDSISDGAMHIQIYDSGQLGGEASYIELLQMGSLDLTKVSSGALENFVKEFRIFGVPYIFPSKAIYYDIIDGKIGKSLLKAAMGRWILGLAFYDSGARSFYTKEKPIHHPDDLKGVKMRVMPSAMAVEMMRCFGGSATPVDFGELYTALQSGVVDGAENNTPSITTAFHHETCRYYSVNEHTMLPDVVLVSLHTWEKLSPQEQAWLQEAFDASVIYQRKLWAAQEVASMQEMKAKGMEISYPDKAPFIERLSPMIEEYKHDETLGPIIHAIEEEIIHLNQ